MNIEQFRNNQSSFDTGIDLSKKSIPDILTFNEKIKKRILSQFISTVKRNQLEFSNYIFPLGIIILPILMFLNHIWKTEHGSWLDFLSCVLYLPLIGAALVCIGITCSGLKAFTNFKKSSDNYFGLIDNEVPMIENKEMDDYLKGGDFDDMWYCHKDISSDEKAQILEFTPSEIKEFSQLSFNEEQKDYLLEMITQDGNMNFYCLTDLIEISDEINIPRRKEEQNEIDNNIKKYSQFIKTVGINVPTPEPLKENIKYKLKELL